MEDYTQCPLHWLVYSDEYYDLLEKRLKDPNEEDMEGYTLLQLATQSPMGNSRIVQLLIEKGADVNYPNADGHTALHFAVASRKRDIVVSLIEAGGAVNAKDLMGRTALHFSVCNVESNRPLPIIPADFDMWIVERLLSHPGICVNLMDPAKETPLMWAVKEQNSGAVTALLKKGADPDIPRLLDNRTALHEALYARNPNVDTVSALLTYGAGIYCEDILRKTTVDLLVRNVLAGFDETLLFAKYALMLIALLYRIRKSVWRKLEHIPELYYFLKDCCKEVRAMRKLIIYDNVTLHDVCLNCFQTRFGDPLKKIYVPTVEMLISESFQKYYSLIYCRLSQSDLRSVLEITVGRSFALDLLPEDASKQSVLYVIRRVYSHSVELKRRLRNFKHLLRQTFDLS